MKLNHKSILPKNSRRKILSSSGFSLIEILVAMGIMTIMMMAMLSLMTSSQKSARQLQQKLEVIEFRQVLDKYLIDSTSCECMFADPGNPITFSGTLPVNLPGGLQMGCPGPGAYVVNAPNALPNSQLRISKISLEDPVDDGTGRFTTDLTVAFAPDPASLPLKPLTIRQVFTTVANKITQCNYATVSGVTSAKTHRVGPFNGAGSSTCPAGYLLSMCHAEVNSGDGQSRMYQQHLTISPPNLATTCSSNMTDAADSYFLVLICVK